MNVLKTATPGEDKDEGKKKPLRFKTDAETAGRLAEADKAMESDEIATTKKVNELRTGTKEAVKTVKIPEAELKSSGKPIESFARTQADLDRMQHSYLAMLEDAAVKEIPIEAASGEFHKKMDAIAKDIAAARGKAIEAIYNGSPESVEAKKRISKARQESIKGYADVAAEGSKNIVLKVVGAVGTGAGAVITGIGKPAIELLKQFGLGAVHVGGEGLKIGGRALKDVVLSLWSMFHDAAKIRNEYNQNKPTSSV